MRGFDHDASNCNKSLFHHGSFGKTPRPAADNAFKQPMAQKGHYEQQYETRQLVEPIMDPNCRIGFLSDLLEPKWSSGAQEFSADKKADA